MDVTVVIASYGDQEWADLAKSRALPSVPGHAGVVLAHEGENIAEARNAGLAQVKSEWVIHLDADDELSPGYIEAMARGTADVRGPNALYIQRENGYEVTRWWQPRVFRHTHDCTGDCLTEGNWLIVGSAVRTKMLRDVGGWRDFPWSEDWDTWLRCYRAGATFELIRNATYRAHVRLDSRNRAPSEEEKWASHQMIARANGL